MTTYTVGPGEEFATIAAAVAQTQDGDTVLIQAGTYVNDFFTTYNKITLQSVGGLAILDATESPSNGKGIITSETDLTVNGLGFTGAAVGDANGAGIRYEGGNLVVQNSVFWNNQDGILATPLTLGTGTVTITGSEFSHNGAGDGSSHNIYIGEVASLMVDNSYFHDASVGHEVKSRALATTITNSRIQDNATGTASYDVDLPDGGVDVLNNDVIQKGADTSNIISIHTGGDGTQYANTSLTVTNSTLINDNADGYLLLNQTGVTDSFSNNQVYNYQPSNLAVGPVTFTNDTTLATEPALDTSTIVPTGAAAPVVPVPVDPVIGSTLPYWGPAGAVVASGHILTVGAGRTYATLQAALDHAVDGDTIEVAAGTYTDQTATITHKVIIEGVGGMAKFVETTPGSVNGVFNAEADCTIENVSITGGMNINGAEAGVYVTAGNVTVDNSYIYNNDIGLESGNDASANLAVFNSDIVGNGNVNKGRHNIEVFAINSLTIQDSFVSKAVSGHEVYSLAFNTDIENDRIVDTPGVYASYLIDLGAGGNAIIKNNLLVKGPQAVNGVLINVGNEDTPYSNTNVQITGNTLDTQITGGYHPYTYFINGNAKEPSLAPITVSNNTFVGGVPGSAWLVNATDGGGNVAAASAVIDTQSATSTAAIPMGFTKVGGSEISVVLSEGAGGFGNAGFNLLVDGVVVDTGVVTASHAAGANQTFAFMDSFTPGAHTVTVEATEPQGFDTLYLTNVSLDGVTVQGGGTVVDTTGFSTTLTATGGYADFDPTYYLAHNPDVAAAGVDPLAHYLGYGWKEGRDPSALFDTNYYLTQNPDVKAANVDPMLHFEEYGWKEGREPSLLFNDAQYLAANPDVAAAYVDPLAHYMEFGQYEGRMSFLTGGTAAADPLIDPAYYDPQLGATLIPTGTAAAQQAAYNYDTTGWQQGLNPDQYFNAAYYLAHNPDVAAAHVDPLLHYEEYGWKEGRNPSALFDTNAYLNANPDVKAANVDPLLHYVEYGQFEGRPIYAAPT